MNLERRASDEGLTATFRGHLSHELRVSSLCEELAVQFGASATTISRLRIAGAVHDIGKIFIAREILEKPGALDAAEWDEIRRHPALGASLIQASGLTDVASWVLAHHERPDGRGYPFGLGDEEIPFEAKILSVADAFDAMTSARAYNQPLDLEDAIAELEAGAGTQFDHAVVQALAAAMPAVNKVTPAITDYVVPPSQARPRLKVVTARRA